MGSLKYFNAEQQNSSQHTLKFPNTSSATLLTILLTCSGFTDAKISSAVWFSARLSAANWAVDKITQQNYWNDLSAQYSTPTWSDYVSHLLFHS